MNIFFSRGCVYHEEYFQVETVGDKYMAVSGIPEPCVTHAKNIAKLALDMMERSTSVYFDGEQVVSICQLQQCESLSR